MKTANSVLMKQAREALDGKWGLAIGVYLLSFIIIVGLQSLPGIGRFYPGEIISFVITGPLSLGLAIFSLSLSRIQSPKLQYLFDGFDRIGVTFWAYLLTLFFTILWALLLLIPGIIASLSYSMTFYILADDVSIGARDAIKKSKIMMNGNKWKFFCLNLRFIGWALLSILTLGIGFLWLIPYAEISAAKFYDDIKDRGPVAIT